MSLFLARITKKNPLSIKVQIEGEQLDVVQETKCLGINLDNGKTLHIKAINQSKENIYVNRVSYNGEILKNNTLQHSDLMNGGELIFEMSAIVPDKK